MSKQPISTVEAVSAFTKDNVANRAEWSTMVKRQESFVKIPVDKIRVREGFNLRMDFGDIDGLADSIGAQGLLKPLLVDAMKDGRFFLVDGERRFKAILKLQERGQEFPLAEAMINGRNVSEMDRVLVMLASNDAKNFEPIEEANGYRRLRDEYKLEPMQIARAVGKSIAFVEQRLLLGDASTEEQELVQQGDVSATVVMEQMRKEKDPVKRVARIKEAKAKGTKLKVKDVKGPKIADQIEELHELVKEANKKNKNQAMADLLFSMDKTIRSIKKSLK